MLWTFHYTNLTDKVALPWLSHAPPGIWQKEFSDLPKLPSYSVTCRSSLQLAFSVFQQVTLVNPGF